MKVFISNSAEGKSTDALRKEEQRIEQTEFSHGSDPTCYSRKVNRYAEKDDVDKMSSTKPMMMPGSLREGDFVETVDGRVGYIKSICRCEKCRERGFYEPIVHFTDGEEDCITKYEAENGFKGYKRIGRWVNEKAVVKKPKDIFHCGSVWKSENGTMRYVPDTQVMQDKINELVDAVNELRKAK